MSSNVTTIKDRIREIIAEVGGPSALARRAGLTPSTIAQYLSEQEGRASEPGATALVKLAKAANVNLAWLATGEGGKELHAVPEGYFLNRVFDLSATGNHIRGILDQFGQHPRELKGRLIKTDDLIGKAPALSLESYVVENGEGLKFEPEICEGDIFIFSVPHGHEVALPSNVERWEFLEEKEEGIYLVASGVELKLRKLRRQKESVQVLTADGKVEMRLTGKPRDFIVFGRVIWRAGVINSGVKQN